MIYEAVLEKRRGPFGSIRSKKQIGQLFPKDNPNHRLILTAPKFQPLLLTPEKTAGLIIGLQIAQLPAYLTARLLF